MELLVCILCSFSRQCFVVVFFSGPGKAGTANSPLWALAVSHVIAQQTIVQQRGFGAQYTQFCQMFTALINHLLAKLTLGNYCGL